MATAPATTTPTPEALSATIIVHVYGELYEPPGEPGTCAERLRSHSRRVPGEEVECDGETLLERLPDETEPLPIRRLTPNDEGQTSE